jgi:hypothetical protein
MRVLKLPVWYDFSYTKFTKEGSKCYSLSSTPNVYPSADPDILNFRTRVLQNSPTGHAWPKFFSITNLPKGAENAQISVPFLDGQQEHRTGLAQQKILYFAVRVLLRAT